MDARDNRQGIRPTEPLPWAPGVIDPPGTARHADNEAAQNDVLAAAQSLIMGRRNISPRRLAEPGPSPAQLEALFELASAAPDHGLLTPWRFVLVPLSQRHLLAEVFALALIDRDPGATLDQIEAAREKAHRAPVLFVAIACLGPREPDTPLLERMVSMGAAIQNILLGAHAMGFGGGLTSGQAMTSPRLRELLSLVEGEDAVCCVNLGSVSNARPGRHRPAPASFVRALPALHPVQQ